MAVTRRLVFAAFVLLVPVHAFAQAAGEIAFTTGASTDRVAAVATQARVFADTDWLRVFGEVAWAGVSGPESDVFGSTYPYENRLTVMDAYAEKMFRRDRGIVGVRAGRFRTPFGIYQASDHAYAGFLRAPLIRYEGCWALSNMQLEHGVNFIGGVPWLQLEATFGTPSDAGDDPRRAGLDQVLRVQTYYGGLIVGASHIRTQPYQPAKYAHGRTVFTGFDVRWMRDGVQLKSEVLTGRAFDGVHTRGGYIDASVHRREMGPVTAVFRVEALDYEAGPRSHFAKRATAGARVRLADGLYAQVSGSHQAGALYEMPPNAIDAAVTYTVRFGR
jgi:hypothetical protein